MGWNAKIEPTAAVVNADRLPAPESLSSREWLLAAAFVAAVFAAYQPVWHDGFIWDDDQYVTQNRTLHDVHGLWRIWSDRHANPQYYPLVHTSFWLEYHLWGLNPLGYHLVNVALHAANVVLLLLVLRRLHVPGAFWAAALFAVHPVMVESVAWITERKNVLSAFFYLCSFWSLLHFWPPEQESPRPAGRWRYYVLALLLFAAALFSKTAACSLPAAFLLVRWWKQGRLTRRDACMTAPFFALGLVLALNTAELEKQHVGASGKEWDFSALERTLIAGRALWFYVGSLAWPAELTFIYPRWQIEAGAWRQYLYPLAAVAVIGALWALRKRLGRGPLTAVLFFAGALVPALGFVNVYPMRFSFVADHFQYLASMGLLALAGAAVEWLRSRLARILRLPIAAVCCLILAVLAVLTWRQAGIYKDVPTLWRDTLVKNPSCWMAYNNLGFDLAVHGQVDEAIDLYWTALKIKPDYAEAYINLGAAVASRGQFDEAVAYYQKALQINPDYALAYNNLGIVLADHGQTDEAIAHFHKALEIQPDFALAHNNLGNILAGRGHVDEAIVHFRQALATMPDYAEAHYNLGIALLATAAGGRRQIDEAVEHFRTALAIKPDYAEAHYYLGNIAGRRAQIDEAMDHLRKALNIKPDYAQAHNDLGAALAGRSQFVEAIEHFQKVVELTPDSAQAYYSLGNALAGCEQFDKAREQYQKALHLAAARNDAALCDAIQEKLTSLRPQ